MEWLWLLCGIVLLFGFVVFRGAPYVPSHRKYVRLALTQLYPVTANDQLVDLGSGDGLVLRVARELGVKRAIGYELNPVLVLLSNIFARGDSDQKTYLSDMWFVDIPDETTIIYIFAVTRDSKKLTKKLQQHVNKTGKILNCITYGAGLDGRKPLRTLHAHSLYRFQPK